MIEILIRMIITSKIIVLRRTEPDQDISYPRGAKNQLLLREFLNVFF